jgi:hypothetical protein
MLDDDPTLPPPANGPSFGPSPMLEDFEHHDGSSSNRT